MSIDSSRVRPREDDDHAVGDELVAGLDPDQVAGDDLVGAQLDQLAVADGLRPRRDQQRELVERLLGLQLLADPDRRVDHRDEAEEGVGEQAERQHEDEEDAEDRVEEREDVAGDDARDRAAGGRLRHPQAVQPPRRLGAGQPRRVRAARSFVTIYTGAPGGRRYGSPRVSVRGGSRQLATGPWRPHSVAFRRATKRYPGAEQPALRELDLEVSGGEICVFVGPSGCGKTTAMRMVNRMVEITEGDILVGGHLGAGALALPAAARDRLRDPADRAVPPPHDRRQHRHRSAAARLGSSPCRRSGRRADGPGADRPGASRPLPGAALRRPAAARGGGARARRQPRRDADGRAVRGRRPDQPRAAPERVPAPPGRGPQDDPVRHPRHRRGDQDGRPDRDPARGWASWPSTRLRRSS